MSRLRASLLGGTWSPGPYRSFYVFEAKKRLLSATPFPDRVVHHTLQAHRIALAHPEIAEPVNFAAPLREHLSRLLEALRLQRAH